MSCKFRIKLGPVEVEYEGNEEYKKEKLLELASEIMRIYESSEKKAEGDSGAHDKGTGKDAGKGTGVQLTTGNIASKLDLGKGKELLLASCAYLEFLAHKETYKRDDILAQAKTATGFYKTSHGANLTIYLKRLVSAHKLNEIAEGTYTMTDKVRNELKVKLGIS